MPDYAIIGWGSLLWDLDCLADQTRGPWRINRGPLMPLEFTRVSLKRDRALALVVDLEHGAWCRTSTIFSRRTDIRETVKDLAKREHTDEKNIGVATRDGQFLQSRHEQIARTIGQWLETTGYAGAVWTDTSSNFESIARTPFTVSSAIDYLQTLSDDSIVEARRYITNAPAAVQTPLRDALRENRWWQDVVT